MRKLRLPRVKKFIAVEVIYSGNVDEIFDEQLRTLAGRRPDACGRTLGVDRDQSWYFDLDKEQEAEKLAGLIEAKIKWRGIYNGKLCPRPRSVTIKVFGGQAGLPPMPASNTTDCPD